MCCKVKFCFKGLSFGSNGRDELYIRKHPAFLNTNEKLQESTTGLIGSDISVILWGCSFGGFFNASQRKHHTHTHIQMSQKYHKCFIMPFLIYDIQLATE